MLSNIKNPYMDKNSVGYNQYNTTAKPDYYGTSQTNSPYKSYIKSPTAVLLENSIVGLNNSSLVITLYAINYNPMYNMVKNTKVGDKFKITNKGRNLSVSFGNTHLGVVEDDNYRMYYNNSDRFNSTIVQSRLVAKSVEVVDMGKENEKVVINCKIEHVVNYDKLYDHLIDKSYSKTSSGSELLNKVERIVDKYDLAGNLNNPRRHEDMKVVINKMVSSFLYSVFNSFIEHYKLFKIGELEHFFGLSEEEKDRLNDTIITQDLHHVFFDIFRYATGNCIANKQNSYSLNNSTVNYQKANDRMFMYENVHGVDYSFLNGMYSLVVNNHIEESYRARGFYRNIFDGYNTKSCSLSEAIDIWESSDELTCSPRTYLAIRYENTEEPVCYNEEYSSTFICEELANVIDNILNNIVTKTIDCTFVGLKKSTLELLLLKAIYTLTEKIPPHYSPNVDFSYEI